MFERLLAALIILAMLVLIMFIAFPDAVERLRQSSAGLEPHSVVPKEQDQIPEKKQSQPKQAEKPEEQKPPTAQQGEKTAQAKPETSGKPSATPEMSNKPTVVPSPGTPPPKSMAPPPHEKMAEKPPAEKSAEQKPEAQPPQQASKDQEQMPYRYTEPTPVKRPVPNEAHKENKLRIASFRERERPAPRYGYTKRYVRPVPEEDRIGGYIRRTQYSGYWRRPYYEYDCGDVPCNCDCSSSRPYWARSNPNCWND